MVVAVEAMAAVPSTTVAAEAMGRCQALLLVVAAMAALASITVAETMVVASITDITAGNIVTKRLRGLLRWLRSLLLLSLLLLVL